MSERFKDYFSDKSKEYGAHRPGYPDELFSYLSSLSKSHNRAWDCGTGSGQSAVALSKYYAEVIGTDASKNQIENAIGEKGVRYRVEGVENTSLESNSIDLITVAQALHWFNVDKFSYEVMRVLKNNGHIAVWTYGILEITPEINSLISNKLYDEILDKYWPPERKIVEEGYKNVALPFEEIDVPKIKMKTEWNLSQLEGYLRTWSAVKKCEAETGSNPVDSVFDEISTSWGNPESEYTIEWPLTLRVWMKNI